MISDESTTIIDLKNTVRAFIDERDWSKYHNPKDIAISIAIEAAELMEHFQWTDETEVEKIGKDPVKMAEIEQELADVVIYCFSFASAVDIDIARAVINKIEKNKAKYPAEQVRGNYKKYTELRRNEDHK
ncbi:MAG: nucleotide pyrophosphohydrolase [Chloroflexi bacterium]|jgi:dCTP diphosphatase|nr:nucleotide pyrophosphohydrolase [Chloroflexota bacterium]